jgi:membrane protease YdiL (CAAX protease family)
MRKIPTYRWQLLFSFAIIGFALTAHREAWQWWRWGFLAMTGIGLCGGWAAMDDPLETIFGKNRQPHIGWRIVMVACLAIPATMGYRRLLLWDSLPASLHWFALPAMAIGAIEEVVWRGWLQGSLSKTLPPAIAIVIATGLHAFYKTALFIFPPSCEAIRSPSALAFIAGWTFGIGVLLGIVRLRQGTIAAPVGFHMLFDLLVYGHLNNTPWWVL